MKKMCSDISDEIKGVCSDVSVNTCGDGMPFVEKSPINQRFLRFRQKKGCVILVPQSDDISGGLP